MFDHNILVDSCIPGGKCFCLNKSEDDLDNTLFGIMVEKDSNDATYFANLMEKDLIEFHVVNGNSRNIDPFLPLIDQLKEQIDFENNNDILIRSKFSSGLLGGKRHRRRRRRYGRRSRRHHRRYGRRRRHRRRY